MADTDSYLAGLACRDIEAFRRLYQCYYKPLVLFALRYIDDVAAAEDVVEDVFVAMWEQGGAFADAKALEGYVYNAVRNRCLNALRSRDVHLRYADEVRQTTGEEGIDGEQAHAFEMRYVRLFEALDQLPVRQREVMLLYMEGMGNQDIAERLELSVETVKTHRKRAMAMLRQSVQGAPVLAFLLHFFKIL